MRVENILKGARERLATVAEDALLMDAAKLLGNPGCNLIVVCDESGKAIGVITRTDIASRISHCTGCSCSMPASKVMSTEIVSCRPNDVLRDVWFAIRKRGLKNVPIVDDRAAPIGVANARDVLQSLLEDVEHEEKLLQDYVMGIGYQ